MEQQTTEKRELESADDVDDGLIVNEDGRPFEQSAFSAYVRRMWKQLCGKEMPAKMVRNVVVTEMFDGRAPEAVRT